MESDIASFSKNHDEKSPKILNVATSADLNLHLNISTKSAQYLENELNKINSEIREIKNMQLPWDQRFDLLAEHVKCSMRHLRILRKEYDDLFNCYEEKFREVRGLKNRIFDLEKD